MNLLPNTEKEDLKRGLKLRFIVVLLFLFATSFLVGFVMLLPSYLLTRVHFFKVASEERLPKIEEDILNKEILKIPQEIDSKLRLFQSNITDASVAEFPSKIISYLPPKVTLDSIYFSRDVSYKEKKGIRILISGIAASRDSLVLFSSSLQRSGLFSSVDVPVSNLTKDKNLPFSMNIFIENKQ